MALVKAPCAMCCQRPWISTFSAGDLIGNINGEQYGANKTVKNKDVNQDILGIEVKKKLEQYPTILLAGHFCLFDKSNCVEKLPNSIFEKISIGTDPLLKADPVRISTNLSIRDKNMNLGILNCC